MDTTQPDLFLTDDVLKERGWRAVARNTKGAVVSLMAPGFFDEYLRWVGDMERRGHTITELDTK